MVEVVAFGHSLKDVAQLYVVAFGTGVGTVFFQVAYQAYLATLVNREDLTAGNARLQGSSSVAMVGGPGLGGLLSQLTRAPYALAVDAASYLVSAVTLLAIRTREAPRHLNEREPLRREVRAGARFVLADPLLRVLTIAPAAGNPYFAGMMALAVLFLVRTVGVRPGVAGVLLAASSLGGIAGALLARRIARALGTARAMWLTMALTAPAALLIPLTSDGGRLVCFVAGMFVLEAGILVYNVTISAWRQAYVPPALIGRVVATMRFLLFGDGPARRSARRRARRLDRRPRGHVGPGRRQPADATAPDRLTTTPAARHADSSRRTRHRSIGRSPSWLYRIVSPLQ